MGVFSCRFLFLNVDFFSDKPNVEPLRVGFSFFLSPTRTPNELLCLGFVVFSVFMQPSTVLGELLRIYFVVLLGLGLGLGLGFLVRAI